MQTESAPVDLDDPTPHNYTAQKYARLHAAVVSLANLPDVVRRKDIMQYLGGRWPQWEISASSVKHALEVLKKRKQLTYASKTGWDIAPVQEQS